MGLQSPEKPYGTWTWLDSAPAPGKRSYTHWGTSIPDNKREPDQRFTCVTANASEAFEDPLAWGWSDDTCDMALPFMCKRAREGAFVYVSNATQATYTLNTTQVTWAEAQAACNENGGHLASYVTPDEQSEVEGYFESKGMFITRYHIFYWTGLHSDQQQWPEFKWDAEAGSWLECTARNAVLVVIAGLH